MTDDPTDKATPSQVLLVSALAAATLACLMTAPYLQ